MQLIIIQGQSGTGKTTLAKRLAGELGYDMFLKDEYKEDEFDKLGKKPDMATFSKIESASWKVMYGAVSEAVRADRPLIIEGNFRYKRRRALQELLKPDTSVVEVFCYARGWVPFRRYVARNRRGERHKGHLDHIWYVFVFWEVFLSMLGRRVYRPLALSDAVYKLDTTDFSKIDYGRIIKYISERV